MKLLVTEKDIKRDIKDVAKLVNDFNLNENDVFVCLLTGGVFFFTDLMQELYKLDHSNKDLALSFMKTKSYKRNKEMADDVQIVLGLDGYDLNSKRIWLVDDIYDSGRTIRAIVEYIQKELHFEGVINAVTYGVRDGAAFCDGLNEHVFARVFKRDDWIVGYGLDDNGTCRNLPCVCTI